MTKNAFKVHNKTALLDKLISKEDAVLDVGFWGQGITINSKHWPHKLILSRAKEVYGIDIEYDETQMVGFDKKKYLKAKAENFTFDKKFDIVFAGDLIEHLVNPGLFLENVKENIAENGKLVITTPNTFNLFNIAGKFTNFEPVVNSDHTFYFNVKTLKVLLEKCGWEVSEYGYMYTLEYDIKESYKKKFLNLIYRILSKFTPKFYETLIVIAKPKSR